MHQNVLTPPPFTAEALPPPPFEHTAPSYPELGELTNAAPAPHFDKAVEPASAPVGGGSLAEETIEYGTPSDPWEGKENMPIAADHPGSPRPYPESSQLIDELNNASYHAISDNKEALERQYGPAVVEAAERYTAQAVGSVGESDTAAVQPASYQAVMRSALAFQAQNLAKPHRQQQAALLSAVVAPVSQLSGPRAYSRPAAPSAVIPETSSAPEPHTPELKEARIDEPVPMTESARLLAVQQAVDRQAAYLAAQYGENAVDKAREWIAEQSDMAIEDAIRRGPRYGEDMGLQPGIPEVALAALKREVQGGEAAGSRQASNLRANQEALARTEALAGRTAPDVPENLTPVQVRKGRSWGTRHDVGAQHGTERAIEPERRAHARPRYFLHRVRAALGRTQDPRQSDEEAFYLERLARPVARVTGRSVGRHRTSGRHAAR